MRSVKAFTGFPPDLENLEKSQYTGKPGKIREYSDF